jgi:hypothetical protein
VAVGHGVTGAERLSRCTNSDCRILQGQPAQLPLNGGLQLHRLHGRGFGGQLIKITAKWTLQRARRTELER